MITSGGRRLRIRVEIQAVLAALRSRLPGLALAASPGRRPEFVIRGLTELLVTSA